jgi:hypothetical protein
MANSDHPGGLDALSEMLALSSYGNTKNVLMTAVEMKGPVDAEAMAQASRMALKTFPEFGCCIEELRRGPRFHLFRNFRPDIKNPVIISDVPSRSPGSSSFDDMVAYLRPRLDREWDLFHEPPAEVHILRLKNGNHVLAGVLHHVAADAGVASELGKKILELYHEMLTGNPPEWSGFKLAMSTNRKRRVRVVPTSWRDVLVNAKDAVSQMLERPVLPVGTGDPTDRRQHQVKRVLSLEETGALFTWAAAKQVSFIDFMVACTNIAIDRWNGARSISPGLVTTSMSVNMRGRYQRDGAPNHSGLIFFRSPPDEREDAGSFARSLALSRIKQFRRQKDHKFYRDVQLLNATLRPLPFGMKRRLTNFVMNQHQFSVAITLLGVVWPGVRNGRPTQDTCVTKVVDADVTALHGVGYKLLSSTHLLFIIYIFQNRLNFVLASSASHFTRQEAESFMDLVLDQLLQRGFSRTLER